MEREKDNHEDRNTFKDIKRNFNLHNINQTQVQSKEFVGDKVLYEELEEEMFIMLLKPREALEKDLSQDDMNEIQIGIGVLSHRSKEV